MATGRYIRLKEVEPSTDKQQSPSASYLEGTDGSLTKGPFTCRTDHNGFIETGNPNRQNHPAMVFLGDSFVESMFNAEASRFVSRAENLLDKAGIHFSCRNGGYSGATTLQLLNVLINKIYPLVGTGGTVILFAPQSDVHIFGAPATYWHPTDRYAPIMPPLTPEATQMLRGFNSTAQILEIIVGASRSLGINLVLATSPYRSAARGEDSWLDNHLEGDVFNTVLARRALLAEKVREIAARTGVPLIDAAKHLDGKFHLFFDELHLNDAGQSAFADWLSQEIVQLDFVH
ncbi:SGNH/GDSL hydrolase family protein [Arthrobacter sp. YAF17]|uniref:SGNH/GDSL hydrolase family protein n=1 Tax=Arthrobacter sp. YAF17 TaxID=3233077 RepID=UPI003F8F1225